MHSRLLKQLTSLKHQYAQEGFKILGVFGSFARGENEPRSDIDVLYELDPTFMKNHKGFAAFSRLNSIKEEMRDVLGIEVDIAAKSGLSRTGKKYILKDLQRV